MARATATPAIVEPSALPDEDEMRRMIAKLDYELKASRGREKQLAADLRTSQEEAAELRAAIAPTARMMIDEDGVPMPAMALGAEDFDFADPRIVVAGDLLQPGGFGRLALLGALFTLLARQARDEGGGPTRPILARIVDKMLPTTRRRDGRERSGSDVLLEAGLACGAPPPGGAANLLGQVADRGHWINLRVGPWRPRP